MTVRIEWLNGDVEEREAVGGIAVVRARTVNLDVFKERAVFVRFLDDKTSLFRQKEAGVKMDVPKLI